MSEITKKALEDLNSYNFWDNQAIPVGFERPFYMDQLKPLIGNKLIKVLTGQRRCGKSHIMRQLIKSLLQEKIPPENILYFNKEIVEFDTIQTHTDLHQLIKLYEKTRNPKGKCYLFLDEVQNIQGWEKLVNSLSQDYAKDYEVWLTGSNSTLLSGELATLLSGRYIAYEIFPFSYTEYCEFFKKEKEKKSYLEYLQTGGLPELFHLSSTEIKRHYVQSLLDSIVLKDIVQRYSIKDSYLLERVFKFLIDNIGNTFSIKSIVDFLTSHHVKTNHETISNYIQYLKQTFVIHEVDRFDIKGKSILSGSKKYYLNDLAFKNYLSGTFDIGLGKSLENAIFLHFKQNGYQCKIGKIGTHEIDFIIEKNNQKKYIQVAHSIPNEKVAEREFGNLEKIRDAYEKIVITLDDHNLGNKEGIQHIQAWIL